jgi:hypothetical protein
MPNKEEIWKKSGNPQSLLASVSGADRQCGEKCVVESLAVFGLAINFLPVSWQGYAGVIKALPLVAAGNGGGKPLVLLLR